MEEILQVIAEPLGALLLVLINAVAAMAIRWVHSHTKSENMRMAADTLKAVAVAEVNRLNTQVVAALKDDGKFSDAEQQQIKATALKAIIEQLPAPVKKATGYMVNDLEAYVNSLIELAVTKLKK
jgi:hypothetical protein